MNTHVFQIFHDKPTHSQIDPGFTPLDNTASPKPQWRDYWAIRSYFLSQSINEDDLYGFLSSDFGSRTALTAQTVQAFIDDNPGCDAYTFSPAAPDEACYLNVFEQGNRRYPGFIELAEAYLREVPLEVDLRTLAMDSRSTVSGNYVVAKPSFWQTWFALTEKLFDLCESGNSAFCTRLNALAVYGPEIDFKGLLVEHLASLVLALCPDIKVAAFDSAAASSSGSAFQAYEHQTALLDELKASSATEARPPLNNFYALRGAVLEACEGKRLSRAKDGFLGTPFVASPDMLYVCFTHVPPPFEFPPNVSMLYLGESQGAGRANLRDLAPEWEPHHPQLGSLVGCFALRNYIVENKLQVRQVGMCQYRKFISSGKVGGVPAENYPVMDVVSRGMLDIQQMAEAMAPGERDFLLGKPALLRSGYLHQYQDCHHPEDLLRFTAAALELGVLSRQDATPFLAEMVFLPGGIEAGVFPTDFWIRAISSIEAVVRLCVERYPVRREGYQARAWGFCSERLGSFLLLRYLVATYGVDAWQASFVGQLNLLTEDAHATYQGGQ